MTSPKKILIAPLDWGLGHATRMVPIAKAIAKAGGKPILAVSGPQAHFFAAECPNFEQVQLAGVPIFYPEKGNLTWHLAKQASQFLKYIRTEQALTAKLVEKHGISGIISDNRYGVFDARVPSVLVSHQPYPMAPFGTKKLLHKKIERLFEPFQEIWVPDSGSEDNLSGALSHGGGLDSRLSYIGTLSRFASAGKILPHKYHYLGIASGPEPNKSAFAKQLLATFQSTGKPCALLEGKPNVASAKILPRREGNVDIYPHLLTPEFAKLVATSEVVVSRTGYSTIMDLSVFGKTLLGIPTPKQPEQEYLAKYLGNKFGSPASDELGSLDTVRINLPQLDSTLFLESVHRFLGKC